MRLCHGLLGETIDVDEKSLQYQKPFDVIRQRAKEKWEIDVEDLIILSGSGCVVGVASSAADLGSQDIFIFLRSALDVTPGSSIDTSSSSALAVFSLEAEEEELEAEEEANAVVAESFQCYGAWADVPAFETFRCNIVEARRRLAEIRPVVSFASKLESRLQLQGSAVQAVLDNVTSHRETCSRSMALLLQKYEKVQERLDANLSKVEESMDALLGVPLHLAVRTAGRECLADAVPRERIVRFTSSLQEERGRLAQQMEKLKQQDAQVQSLCDQAAVKIQQLLENRDLLSFVADIQRDHARAVNEMLPALEVRLPLERTESDSESFLEEEKRTVVVMENLIRTCGQVRGEYDNLRAYWDKRLATFLQRLREVSYTQSKVRNVQRQAALLEEEINSQQKQSKQLDHIHKMPRAYQKAVHEIGRRREFRVKYLAECEQARTTLARMMEEENRERRAFVQRYGCHLPADLVRGLGSLVPAIRLDAPEFDSNLPDLGPTEEVHAEPADAAGKQPSGIPADQPADLSENQLAGQPTQTESVGSGPSANDQHVE